MRRWLVTGLAVGALLFCDLPRAAACGCFALASPATPVVQAGERILFTKDGGDVVAYVQIQYQGAADQFAWLVPLPAVPTVELGTDELFTQLENATSPQLPLQTRFLGCNGTSSSGTFGCGAGFASNAGAGGVSDLGAVASADLGASDIVVARASLGPYDYAVLKADSDQELVTWLQTNRFFVPSGTDQAVKPYIRPGAYFLALKLQGGESTGDLVPVVLRYPADLPMIPITLTAVGAIPHMGVLVYLLGAGRAIPTNYYHSVLNDLDFWLTRSSYQSLIDRAVSEAPDHHTFFTQFADDAAVMGGRLDYPGRFGDLTVLRTIGDPGAYLAYLRTHGYPFTEGALIALLQRAIPLPPSLGALSPAQYYFAYDSYAWARTPGDGGTSDPFDPVALTDALDQRIVQPSRRAQALLDAQPTLTRLYTTLSPEDMTRDPVFAWNTDLPKVSRFAGATATIPCRGRTWVENDEGLRAYLTASTAGFPATLRLEVLGQEGPPTVLLDHRADLERMLEPIAVGDQTPQTSAPQSAGRGGCFGCAVETGGGAPVGPLLLFALSTAGLVIRRVRGRRLR